MVNVEATDAPKNVSKRAFLEDSIERSMTFLVGGPKRKVGRRATSNIKKNKKKQKKEKKEEDVKKVDCAPSTHVTGLQSCSRKGKLQN